MRIQLQSAHKDPGNCKADWLAVVKIEAYASFGTQEFGVPGRNTCLSARGSGFPPPVGTPGTVVIGTHLPPEDFCARETPMTSQISVGCMPLGHPHTVEEIGQDRE